METQAVDHLEEVHQQEEVLLAHQAEDPMAGPPVVVAEEES